MTGYIQRLLERADTGTATGAAAGGNSDAAQQATGNAPITSPLAESDQRFRMDGFDTDILAAMLFDMPAPEDTGWTIPENPFGIPREDARDIVMPGSRRDQAPVAQPVAPAAWPEFPSFDIPEAPVTDDRPDIPEGRERTRPVSAEPAAAPQPVLRDVERIIEHTETVEREPGETRYLYLRDSDTGEHARPNLQPQEIVVERHETVETLRETVTREEPGADTGTPEPSPAQRPAVSRAEPALRPADPAPQTEADETAAISFPENRSDPVPQERRAERQVRRGENEVTAEAPGRAPFTSAAAASVIGPLPLRPSTLTIRGWRRR